MTLELSNKSAEKLMPLAIQIGELMAALVAYENNQQAGENSMPTTAMGAAMLEALEGAGMGLEDFPSKASTSASVDPTSDEEDPDFWGNYKCFGVLPLIK